MRVDSDLEVEDASITLREALLLRNHSVQELLIQGEAGDGGEQPAVTWTEDITWIRRTELI